MFLPGSFSHVTNRDSVCSGRINSGRTAGGMNCFATARQLIFWGERSFEQKRSKSMVYLCCSKQAAERIPVFQVPMVTPWL